MQFAPDTVDTLEFTVALANTAPGASRSGEDELTTVRGLSALVKEHTYSGRHDRTAAEVSEVRETRDRLRRIWTLDDALAVDEINLMLADAAASPRLVRHDHLDWHFHATPDDAPLAERIRVDTSFALADVLRSGFTERLRVCGADDCVGLLFDLSRNGSRLYCSVRCSNRMSQLAFRERQS
jgi:predicted RNA-binding Zn ribbon-like protein